ncbi:MAG: TyeA family type III secretion system gatekeeper subunit [Chthoniobacterales bacterium]|nr:TyeA family type III secretion system gatekeeper subunit [Chthoniobacterales bacterium]
MSNFKILNRNTAPTDYDLDNLDTVDLQGIYRGKTIKELRVNNDFDFGSQEESDNQEGKSTQSKKAELKNDFQKREQDAFSLEKISLPDFDQFSHSPSFQRFMAQLRRSQRGETYEEIQDSLTQLFQDPTLKSAALTGALKLLKDQEAPPELIELLEQVLQELTENKGSEIRAGYNISQTAASVAGENEDLLSALRNFYCQVVFGNQNLIATYRYIMSSFPDEFEKAKRERQKQDQQHKREQKAQPDIDGVEGEARLEKALQFLFESLAAELKSNRPSSDHPFLKSVMDGLCQIEFFRNAYRSFLQMLTKMNMACSKIPIAPSRLINEIFARIAKETFNDHEFLMIAESFSIPPLQFSIEFLTKIYEMIRLFPERVFTSSMSRENCLVAVQRSLDSAIARESEVAEV